MKIFWSWQDDSPGKTNRHFIKAALEVAVAALAGEYELEDADRPTLDHDTKGVPGAAEIVPVLMDKIANSAVFVADVTPVAKTADGKALPNANVMIELGWSLNKPGWARQIYVLNTASGCKPGDLPFDIRGRRVLTYALAGTADVKAKESAKKALIGDLTAAIGTNLEHHLEEEAAARPIPGVPAKADEPSLWAGAENGFSHQTSFARNQWMSVTIPVGPRAYLRVIPGGWKIEPPDVAAIGRLDWSVRPSAPSHESAGDFGVTKEGYVDYWISSGRDEPRESKDFTMYFEDTGEFWMITGSPIVEYPGGLMKRAVDLATVFQGWATAIRRVHRIFDHFGALPTRRVEVGFTGFDDVQFPGGWYQAARPPARRPELRFDRTLRDWSPEAQEAFLIEALQKVFRLFGMRLLGQAEAATFVANNDPERGRESPLVPSRPARRD
jgi:hypothetical protein